MDIYSGCGGLSSGLTNAGFRVTVAVEIEPAAVRTYKQYKPLSGVNVLEIDICEVDGQMLLKEAGISVNDLYLFAGCPPCQNFSGQNIKNKEKTDDDRKELLFHFLRIIEEIYPPFVLMENVQGITTKFNRGILNEFLTRLKNPSGSNKERYVVLERVLNAADYGVPQLRKRYVLHAVRYDIYLELQKYGLDFALPVATHNRDGKNGLPRWKTVAETIGDLPAITVGGQYKGDENIHNHKCANLSEKNQERMQIIRENGRSRTGLPEHLVLECHKKTDENGNVFAGRKDVYGIMDGNKPSPTITGGCLCYSKGRYGHYSQNRAISIREAARLQTFPDDFTFSDNLRKAALQIGNAVPIKLVESSATELLKTMKALMEARIRKDDLSNKDLLIS